MLEGVPPKAKPGSRVSFKNGALGYSYFLQATPLPLDNSLFILNLSEESALFVSLLNNRWRQATDCCKTQWVLSPGMPTFCPNCGTFCPDWLALELKGPVQIRGEKLFERLGLDPLSATLASSELDAYVTMASAQWRKVIEAQPRLNFRLKNVPSVIPDLEPFIFELKA